MNESGERSSRCVRDESVKVRKKTDKYVMSPLECTYEIDCVNPPRGPSAISEEQATKKGTMAAVDGRVSRVGP